MRVASAVSEVASILVGLLLLFAFSPAHAVGQGCTPAAHVFCVTNTNDTVDTGSGNYAGSLRKAMADANAAGGSNTIGFAIPGSGLHTIALAAQLPAIGVSLTIDGFSQPGSVQNTNTPDQGGLNAQLAIEIVGSGGVGFYYNCCGLPVNPVLTFQGLALHGFSDAISGQSALLVPKAQLNVYGCFIGTKADGTALPANGNSGSAVRATHDNAQVGGTDAWKRNLLSGNGGAGVFAAPADATSAVVIEGNLIGTDASGTLSIPNGTSSNWAGVYVQGAARNIRIGCTSSGNGCSSHVSRNVISGNHTFGISLSPDISTGKFTNLDVKGNYVGLAWNGTALPNGYPEPQNAQYGGGIQVFGSSLTVPAVIGGFGAGEANTLAGNRGPGISAIGATAASFDTRANLIHDNSGPGGTNIALAQYGGSEPLSNDAGDADTGSNNLQNSPEILTAEPVKSPAIGMKVTYRVRTLPVNAAYPIRVDFHFAINGGAGFWFAQDNYPDTAGQDYVTTTLPVTLQVAGGSPWYSFWGPIVAIATSNSGYSSELSAVTNDWIFGDTFE